MAVKAKWPIAGETRQLRGSIKKVDSHQMLQDIHDVLFG
jgi:hypothetical protein